jgi:hypothetical protein
MKFFIHLLTLILTLTFTTHILAMKSQHPANEKQSRQARKVEEIKRIRIFLKSTEKYFLKVEDRMRETHSDFLWLDMHFTAFGKREGKNIIITKPHFFDAWDFGKKCYDAFKNLQDYKTIEKQQNIKRPQSPYYQEMHDDLERYLMYISIVERARFLNFFMLSLLNIGENVEMNNLYARDRNAWLAQVIKPIEDVLSNPGCKIAIKTALIDVGITQENHFMKWIDTIPLTDFQSVVYPEHPFDPSDVFLDVSAAFKD